MPKRAIAITAAAIGTAALALGSIPAAAQAPAPAQRVIPPIAGGYKTVTNDRLKKPEDGDWLMYRRTYDGWGYSPLKQINTQNVKRLTPVWTFATGQIEGHQAPPIVNGRVMFVTTPGNQVLALDSKTGDLIWRYKRPIPEDAILSHPTNRGVALLGDRVYFAAVDTVLVALDARTGKEVWTAKVEDFKTGYYMTLAPLVAENKVLVGVSGGERGIRGFVAAYDAQTGQPAWRSYMVPAPGEPGGETWPRGDQWKTGGGSVWITGVYDPNTNLSFWGTGNGGPWMGDQRPGDNLYTTAVVALDNATGRIKGHFQYHQNDSWDWDEVSSPLLIDFQRGNRTVKGMIHPARNGYLWFLERTTDKVNFVDALPYVKQDAFKSVDAKTGRVTVDESRKPGTGKKADFCPSLWGGKDWPPAAYSPQTKLIYIPANENLCSTLEGAPVTYKPGENFTGTVAASTRLYMQPGATYVGELQAWDVSKRQKVWSHKFEKSQTWGPVLTTGGNLVFMGGTNDRYFRAWDAKTGKVVWQYRTGSGVTGVPVAYLVDGKEYIAVQSGWGVDAQRMQNRMFVGGYGYDPDVPQGGMLWVFAVN